MINTYIIHKCIAHVYDKPVSIFLLCNATLGVGLLLFFFKFVVNTHSVDRHVSCVLGVESKLNTNVSMCPRADTTRIPPPQPPPLFHLAGSTNKFEQTLWNIFVYTNRQLWVLSGHGVISQHNVWLKIDSCYFGEGGGSRSSTCFKYFPQFIFYVFSASSAEFKKINAIDLKGNRF